MTSGHTDDPLRRAFASWLIQGGVSNRIVADLMGHGTTRMVDMVYGKLDEATRHAGDRQAGRDL
ncbi:MAG: tyrosine-type recombinase/integrase [Gemmatimonadaceae bacterium]